MESHGPLLVKTSFTNRTGKVVPYFWQGSKQRSKMHIPHPTHIHRGSQLCRICIAYIYIFKCLLEPCSIISLSGIEFKKKDDSLITFSLSIGRIKNVWQCPNAPKHLAMFARCFEATFSSLRLREKNCYRRQMKETPARLYNNGCFFG